jgi:hypothetical protein
MELRITLEVQGEARGAVGPVGVRRPMQAMVPKGCALSEAGSHRREGSIPFPHAT